MSKSVLGDNPLASVDLQDIGKTLATGGVMMPWLVKDSLKGVVLQEIAVDLIDPNPEQPRKQFDRGSLEEMARSVKDQGVLQPVAVKPAKEGRYVLIMGERRWRAVKLAGLKTIPALIRVDGDLLELALIENVQREDLGPIDTAEALHALKTKHQYTDEALARVVGKSRAWVSNIMSLQRLPEDIKGEARAHGYGVGGVLLEISREQDPERAKALMAKAVKGEMNVEMAREARQKRKKGKAKEKPFTFRYTPKSADFKLTMTFRRKVVKEEIKTALERVIISLDPDGGATDV